ncbi:MAG: hypothetical protein ACLFVB_03070 [Thermoplasmata archaeon]
MIENLDPDDLSSLREVDNWINWIYRDGKKLPVGSNKSKVLHPINALDKDNQMSFEDAYRSAQYRTYIGLGFVFNEDDDFVGIDLDDCIYFEEMDIEMMELVERLDSYTEISPSGKGLHIIVRSENIEGLKTVKNSENGVEIYPKKRFFTITGDVINKVSNIPYRDEDLSKVIDKYRVKKEGCSSGRKYRRTRPKFDKLEDEELLEKAFNSKVGDKFKRLWEGDISDYPSHSEADLALLSYLAYWTNCDRDQMERLFERSGLVRDK